MKEKQMVVIGGTSLNKGGLAIAYGTLKVLLGFGMNIKYMVDPDPSFSKEFYNTYKLNPIYRWSAYFDPKRGISSMRLVDTFIPFIMCIKNSYSRQISQLDKSYIWYIGNSSLNDYRSVLALFGQIVSLSSLKLATNGKLIVNASMGYTRTKIGELLLRNFLKMVDHFFVRGTPSYNNLIRLGVPPEKIDIVIDFAFYLDKKQTINSKKFTDLVSQSQRPAVGLVFKNYASKLDRTKYIEKIKELHNELDKKYDVFFIPTSFVPFTFENDPIFLRELGANKILDISNLDPGEIICVFSKFEAIITTRLHGAVFSTLAGVPTYHIYEAPNSLDVIRDTFGDLVPLQHISDFIKGDVQSIVKDVEGMIQNREKIAQGLMESIDSRTRESKNKLETYFDKIFY